MMIWMKQMPETIKMIRGFYSHQIKEDKMNNIRALREKFEEDKQKIAKMKQERKFRPF